MNRYAICSNDDLSNKSQTFNSAESPTAALEFLQITRGAYYDDGSFIIPASPVERDEFPYRNKIGPLREDDSNHWGYRLRMPNTLEVVSIWIQKLEVGPGIPTLKEDLEDEEVAKKVQECNCDYVVYSTAQADRDRMFGRRWDEKTKDFIFDEEREVVARDGEAGAGQAIEGGGLGEGQVMDQ